MSVYAWRGINASGKDVKGIDDADSPKALRSALRRKGVLVTKLEEESTAAKRDARNINFKRFFGGVSQTDIALVTRQLATLLKAGIPLVEALDALIEQADKEDLRNALTNTRDKVNEGIAFNDALRAHPKIFSDLFVNMVAAGEVAGNLDAVLARLADVLEAQARLKSKVTSALAYPIVMMVMSLGVVTVMMTVVVPQVTAIFEDFGQVLPWYTRLLMFVSDMFVDWWFLLIGAAVGSWYGFRRWLSTEKGRKNWDLMMLRLPLIGALTTKVACARFARTLSTLLASGVPVLGALDITRNVLVNTELMRVVADARESIREGESIAKPLAQSKRFPPIVTHMIAIGERSGELEAMLENVADAYDDQVDKQVAAMTSLLEPLMIVVMGGINGGITAAILVPLMQMNEFVGG
ncbi:MAG TPA: type II secretion system inner membrane protein GspF [Polyangiales bacterium]|nr:type II secretion system inner membrane protein GspF [Polyangiales bacterium]